MWITFNVLSDTNRHTHTHTHTPSLSLLVGKASLLSDGGVEESRAQVAAIRKWQDFFFWQACAHEQMAATLTSISRSKIMSTGKWHVSDIHIPRDWGGRCTQTPRLPCVLVLVTVTGVTRSNIVCIPVNHIIYNYHRQLPSPYLTLTLPRPHIAAIVITQKKWW